MSLQNPAVQDRKEDIMKMNLIRIVLVTLLTSSTFTLSATDSCTNPATQAQKNVCDLQGYLSRYDGALQTLLTLIQNGLEKQAQSDFQTAQADWQNSINQQIQDFSLLHRSSDPQTVSSFEFSLFDLSLSLSILVRSKKK